jgi:hypothetical protein
MEQGRGPGEPIDVDPSDGRRETETERMDRNWNELLQELRVTQTGTQILFGFLLAIAFQPRFADLDDFERGVYLVLIGIAAVTTGLALAPVAVHRGLFRKRRKRAVVQTAHVLLRITLVGVALVLVGTVLLVYDVMVGTVPALWIAGIIGAIIVGAGVLPAVLADRSGR